LTFKTLPAKGAWEALARFEKFMQDVEAARKRLEAPLLRTKAGRLPRDFTHLRLYARWLYQHLVCGQTQYMLGKAYHVERGHKSNYDAEKGRDCRGTVRKGIATAKKLLRRSEDPFSGLP
jgi:hypothetical protein